jgi:CubicO group peptidase (beta-lactamase class C family)
MKARMSGLLLLGFLLAMSLSGCVGILLHVGKKAFGSMSAPSKPIAVVDRRELAQKQVRDELEQALRNGARGVTAIVMRDGHQLFRMDVGDIDKNAQLPVASASKWMAAALVMAEVDRGKLSLDEPVSLYLPELRGTSGKVTLRELLAQTSGEGSILGMVDIKQDPRITLAQSAMQIAGRPLQDPPGQVFRYGGPGFQVAGAAVEAVTGKRWADLFVERIAQPLGMKHTYWEHLPSYGVSAKRTLNPLLQGGVVTTAQDYMRFLTMLAQNGSIDGRRVLSEGAVRELETAQTIGKPKAYLPPGMQGEPFEYALGNWCESFDAEHVCLRMSSPGALGTFPWIDRKSGLYGIFFTRERLTRVGGNFIKARTAIIEAYSPPSNEVR